LLKVAGVVHCRNVGFAQVDLRVTGWVAAAPLLLVATPAQYGRQASAGRYRIGADPPAIVIVTRCLQNHRIAWRIRAQPGDRRRALRRVFGWGFTVQADPLIATKGLSGRQPGV